MFEKLNDILEKYNRIMESLLSHNMNPGDVSKLNKERVKLEPIAISFFKYRKLEKEYGETKKIIRDNDPELRDLAKDEALIQEKELRKIEEELKLLLAPRDPSNSKNIILEIRAGTGGEEAALFSSELLNMYSKFSESMNWKVDVVSVSNSAKGGIREAIVEISGDSVYSWLKFESGIHRVQRVPETESQGRVHTSTCTVAVLLETEAVDLKIEDKDLRIDVFRAGGPGGQSVNTTDSAVRVTHIPSGLVVQCQDEKSQIKNKAKAMKVLMARLNDHMQKKIDTERAKQRKGMVKSGDRSEKTRTFNFPQDRCSDHRSGVVAHNLPKFLAGDIKNFLENIRAYFQSELLSEKEG